MNKKVSFALSIILLSSLVSCDSKTENSSFNSSSLESTNIDFKMVAPNGAPGLAYTDLLVNNPNNIDIAAPNNVVAAFSSNEYDIIIFDALKGANFIAKQNKKYKLASIITAGNCFVMSTGNKPSNDTISDDDYIVSFGQGSIFTELAKKVYNLKEDVDSIVSDVATAASILKSGLDGSNKVDYVLLAEPQVTSVVSQANNVTVKSNLTLDWYNYSKNLGLNSRKGYTGFVQAGLFISERLENDTSKKEVINYILDSINSTNLDLATNNGELTFNKLNQLVSNEIIDSNFFGINLDMIKKANNPTTSASKQANPFGFNYEAFDVNGFLNGASLANFPSLDDSVFSKYYLERL